MESVMSSLIMQLNIHEFCQCAELPQTVVLEIVEHGIVEPSGPTPEQWLFDASALATVSARFACKPNCKLNGLVLPWRCNCLLNWSNCAPKTIIYAGV
jgi:hypothetical protein